MMDWTQKARLTSYLCEKVPRGAVIICPGGGYTWKSPREAEPVAKAFCKIGLHAFVLDYTCEPAPLDHLPLQQLAYAVAQVRQHASQLHISVHCIAVCGFSAGGHLAASLAVLHGDANLFPDGTDLRMHRPDALIACYPVITSRTGVHRGSFEQLAGDDPMKWQRWSLETRVTSDMPPVFLWHTADDQSVSCQNSLCFLQALLHNNVPCEFHLYPYGVHGLSLATPEVEEPEKGRLADPHVAEWFHQMDQWLEMVWQSL